MPRIVRGQLALDTGERLRELGSRVLRLHEYSGEALDQQLRTIGTGLSAQLSHLDSLTKSCRAAKNSYPNFPALRAALAEAGDQVYEIQQEVHTAQHMLNSGTGVAEAWNKIGSDLLELGQRLRLVKFVSDSPKAATG